MKTYSNMNTSSSGSKNATLGCYKEDADGGDAHTSLIVFQASPNFEAITILPMHT
jgi:hypothetical protein